MLLAKAPASAEIRALAKKYGVASTRFLVENPEEECILCGLCVRVCEEVVGVQALSFGGRGTAKHVATPYMVPNTDCVACGTCLAVCPTGAMHTRFDRIRGDVSQRIGLGRTYVGGVR
jgi:predicted molibdopterin-dependent oxidoreductase YjgC